MANDAGYTLAISPMAFQSSTAAYKQHRVGAAQGYARDPIHCQKKKAQENCEISPFADAENRPEPDKSGRNEARKLPLAKRSRS